MLPQDENTNVIQLTFPLVAKARTVDSTVSASTEITLNAATTLLRVYATGQDVYMKWGTTDVTSSNFDEICPAGQIVDFKVPKDVSTSALYTAVNFIERAASAAIVVIEK